MATGTRYWVGWFLGRPVDGASAPEVQGVVFGKTGRSEAAVSCSQSEKRPRKPRMSHEVGSADQIYEENTARAVTSLVLWRTFTHPGWGTGAKAVGAVHLNKGDSCKRRLHLRNPGK